MQARSLLGLVWKGLYAYAAAPDWYLPRRPYFSVALAPLLAISLLGIGMLLIVPATWIPVVLLAIVLNAAGAIGDLPVAAWLLSSRQQRWPRILNR
ncbi:MAG: DUF3267 domain-containing protein [Oscillochloris sp.]|nr:DUF3267 domain-containing protein [Oscillochloris sp.]